jgi:hypothetical protein
MSEPPKWFQMIMYVVISLIAIWVGIRLAWWIGGLTV